MNSTAGNEPNRPLQVREIVSQVREGMAVYDRDDRRIGTIRRVRFADPNDPVDLREEQLDARDEYRPADQAAGTGWGLVRGLLATAGLSPRTATAAHGAAVWGSAAVALAALEVAPPFVFWGRKEVAIDLWHHAVYAGATGLAYRLLDR